METYINWARQVFDPDTEATKVRSRPTNQVYHLLGENTSAYLKIGPNVATEKKKLQWLQDRIEVPQILHYTEGDGTAALLTSDLGGRDLAQLSEEWTPDKVVSAMVKALHKFHAIPTTDCP